MSFSISKFVQNSRPASVSWLTFLIVMIASIFLNVSCASASPVAADEEIEREVEIEECRLDVGQLQINECVERQALVADTMRKVEFVRLIEDLQRSPNFLAGELEIRLSALRDAEKSWELFRDVDCNAIGILYGGSLGSWKSSICRRDMTLERANNHKMAGSVFRRN